jgi:hypothetical protein
MQLFSKKSLNRPKGGGFFANNGQFRPFNKSALAINRFDLHLYHASGRKASESFSTFI